MGNGPIKKRIILLSQLNPVRVGGKILPWGCGELSHLVAWVGGDYFWWDILIYMELEPHRFDQNYIAIESHIYS